MLVLVELLELFVWYGRRDLSTLFRNASLYIFLRFAILVTDSTGSTVENDTNMNGQSFTTETESKWMRHVMFGVFGLAGLLFFITVIYIYNFKYQQIKRLAVAETTKHNYISLMNSSFRFAKMFSPQIINIFIKFTKIIKQLQMIKQFSEILPWRFWIFKSNLENPIFAYLNTENSKSV